MVGDLAYIRVEVKNSGAVTGAEVAQLYVGFQNSTVDRPEKLLRGFERLELAAGETATAEFILDRAALTHYDEEAECRHLDAVPFDIFVGPCSDALTCCSTPLVWKD